MDWKTLETAKQRKAPIGSEAPASKQRTPAPVQKASRRRGSVTKELIMAVASALFREKGYDRTSLEDIAAGLSVTKPSLYYHFSSKEDILLECVASGYIHFQRKIAETDDARLPGRARVRIFMEAYVDLIQDTVLSMVVADERVMSDAGKAKSRNYKRMLNRDLLDRIEAGCKDGSLRVQDPRIAAFGIFGMINWMTHWQAGALNMSPEAVAEQFVSLVLEGIGTGQL
jgi:AcrR family transcriptional regulator